MVKPLEYQTNLNGIQPDYSCTTKNS